MPVTPSIKNVSKFFQSAKTYTKEKLAEKGCPGSDLYHYAKHGKLDHVKRELSKNKDCLAVQGGYSESALQVACRLGHQPIVDAMLNSIRIQSTATSQSPARKVTISVSSSADGESLGLTGVDQRQYGSQAVGSMSPVSNYKINPVDSAVRSKNTVAAKVLLNHGFQVSYGLFIKACSSDDLELVKLMLQHGADRFVNVPSIKLEDNGQEKRWTPLMFACAYGSREVVRLLLTYGATESVSARDSDLNTPLMVACVRGDTEMVQLLLENGAEGDVKKSNKYSWSPLMLACKFGDVKMVRLVLKHKSSIEVIESSGFEDMFKSPFSNSEMRKLAKGRLTALNLNSGYQHFLSLLVLACESGDIEKVDLAFLLRDVRTIQEKERHAIVNIACLRGDVNMLQLLLDRGIKLYVDNGELVNTRVFAYFCEHGDVAKLKLLLDNGAKPFVNKKGLFDYTPLMDACRYGNSDMVELMLAYGADTSINEQVNDYKTAYDFACENPKLKDNHALLEKLRPRECVL